MARAKYDGVVQAVHYDQNGQVLWVRAFLRRGPTWSDRILLDRQSLIDQIKSGKKFVVGKRVPLLASTFETASAIQLVEDGGAPVLITGDQQAKQDNLPGVPVI